MAGRVTGWQRLSGWLWMQGGLTKWHMQPVLVCCQLEQQGQRIEHAAQRFMPHRLQLMTGPSAPYCGQAV